MAGLVLILVVLVVVAMFWANRAQVEAARLAREVKDLGDQLEALRMHLASVRGAVRTLEQGGHVLAPAAAAAAAPVPPRPTPVPPPAPVPEPVVLAPLPSPPPPPPPMPEPVLSLPSIAPASTLTLEERIGARWTTLLGAVVLLLATGFFLRWSFQRGLIGPSLRVTLGLLSGVVMLAAGVVLRRRRDLAYLSIGVAGFGLGALYLSLYAAHARYALVSPATAFAGMALTTLAGAAVSVWSRQQVTAVLAVLGGLLTPILVSTEHPDERVLLIYLILLDLLALAVARFRDWAGLNRLAWLGTVLLLLPAFLAQPKAEHPVARLLLLTVLFAVFLAVPLLRAWSERKPVGRLDLTLVLSNAAAFVSAVYVTLELWWPGLEGPAAWALAAVYLVVGARFRARIPEDEPTEIAHLGAAATLFAAGVPLMFDGPWVTLTWAVQGVALIVLATRTRSLVALAGGPILLGMAVARAAWLDHVWYPAEVPFANVAFLVHAAVVGCLAAAGWKATRVRADEGDGKALRTLLWSLGCLLVVLLLWREPPRPWPEPMLAALTVALAWLAARVRGEPALLGGTALAAGAALVQVLRALADPAPEPPLFNVPFLLHLSVVVTFAIAGALLAAERRSVFWLLAIGLLALLLWQEPVGIWPGVLLLLELLAIAALSRTSSDPALLVGTLLLAAVLLVRVLLADWGLAHQAAQRLWNPWLLLRVFACAAVAVAGSLLPRADGARRAAARALHGVAAGMLLVVLSLGWYEHHGWRARHAVQAADPETAQRARWLAQVGLSVLWTLYAAALLAFGFLRSLAPVRYAGLGLLGVVFLKVMVVDLSRLDAIYRILSFAVLGIVLFGVAFLYQRLQNRRAPAPSP